MDGPAAAQTASASPPPGAGPSVVSDPWRAFLTPQDGAEFLSGWLAITAARLPGSRAATLFLKGEGGRLGVAARWSPGTTSTTADPATLAMAEALLKLPEPLLHRDGDGSMLGWPIEGGGTLQGVLAVGLSQHPDAAAFRLLLRELHWASGWIEARLWQGQANLGRRQADSARLMAALLAACDEHRRFDGAALALVNAVPGETGFDGAALGMLRGGRIRLEALSRQAGFSRRSARARAWEAAMDEALAQAEIVAFPARQDARRMIDQAHRALVRDLGAGLVVSAPLRVRGQVVGVLSLERRAQDGGLIPAAETLDDLRLVTAALAPLLKAKLDERRLISGRLRDLAGRGLSAVLGRRPAIGLGVLAGVLALALPWLVPVQQVLRADATVEGAIQQAATSPVEGFIAAAPVRAGQMVGAGDLLARLDDRDLMLEHAAAAARTDQARQTLREALAQGDRAAGAIARADLAEAAAALHLAEVRLARLEVRAPIDGMVVSGDLSQRIGAPVRQGEVLFEIAELSGWRLRIDLSEYDLALVSPGQTGSAALAGLPGLSVPFRVRDIASVSDPGDGENRFRVEAVIARPPPGLRPGLTGTARITAGDTTLARSWLRGSLDRVRLFLWRFLP